MKEIIVTLQKHYGNLKGRSEANIYIAIIYCAKFPTSTIQVYRPHTVVFTQTNKKIPKKKIQKAFLPKI